MTVLTSIWTVVKQFKLALQCFRGVVGKPSHRGHSWDQKLEHNWKLYSCWLGECSSSFQNIKRWFLLCFVVVVVTRKPLCISLCSSYLTIPLVLALFYQRQLRDFFSCRRLSYFREKRFDGNQPRHVFRSSLLCSDWFLQGQSLVCAGMHKCSKYVLYQREDKEPCVLWLRKSNKIK